MFKAVQNRNARRANLMRTCLSNSSKLPMLNASMSAHEFVLVRQKLEIYIKSFQGAWKHIDPDVNIAPPTAAEIANGMDPAYCENRFEATDVDPDIRALEIVTDRKTRALQEYDIKMARIQQKWDDGWYREPVPGQPHSSSSSTTSTRSGGATTNHTNEPELVNTFKSRQQRLADEEKVLEIKEKEEREADNSIESLRAQFIRQKRDGESDRKEFDEERARAVKALRTSIDKDCMGDLTSLLNETRVRGFYRGLVDRFTVHDANNFAMFCSELIAIHEYNTEFSMTQNIYYFEHLCELHNSATAGAWTDPTKLVRFRSLILNGRANGELKKAVQQQIYSCEHIDWTQFKFRMEQLYETLHNYSSTSIVHQKRSHIAAAADARSEMDDEDETAAAVQQQPKKKFKPQTKKGGPKQNHNSSSQSHRGSSQSAQGSTVRHCAICTHLGKGKGTPGWKPHSTRWCNDYSCPLCKKNHSIADGCEGSKDGSKKSSNDGKQSFASMYNNR